MAESWPAQIGIFSGNVWMQFKGHQCTGTIPGGQFRSCVVRAEGWRHGDLSYVMPPALLLTARLMACFAHLSTELGDKRDFLLRACWTSISTWGQRPPWHTLASLDVEMLVTWRIPPQEHFLFSLCCKHVCLFVCRLHFLIRRESLYSFRRENSRPSLSITII